MDDEELFNSPVKELTRILVREALLGLLSNWSEEELQAAIKHEVMLVAVLKRYPDIYNRFREWARKVPDWAQAFTAEYTYEWLIQNRPDLALVMETPEGRDWLDKNIQALRDAVWSEEPQVATAEEQVALEGALSAYLEEQQGASP